MRLVGSLHILQSIAGLSDSLRWTGGRTQKLVLRSVVSIGVHDWSRPHFAYYRYQGSRVMGDHAGVKLSANPRNIET